MSLWPFMPVGEIVEALEWRTDVLRAQSAEQRIQLRARPRRQWQFSHLFNHDEYAAACAIARGAEDFQVPDWTRQIYGGAVASGSSVSLSVVTADLDLEAGDRVLVMEDRSRWEICTLASVGASAIVLQSVSTARASAGVWPLDEAHAGIELQAKRPAGRQVFADVNFESAQVVDCGASTLSSYRGHDLMSDIPVVGAGQLDEGLAWPAEIFDNDLGSPVAARTRSQPDVRLGMRWHVFTRAAKRTLRQWIFSRRGKLRAFWRSTLARDLSAAADIAAASTSLRVFTPTGALDLGGTAFDIEVNGLAIYRRRVLDVQAGADVDGRPTLTLTLDSALGTDHARADIGRVSFLRCMRFDSDRVEFLHTPGGGLSVAVPCIEVPVP